MVREFLTPFLPPLVVSVLYYTGILLAKPPESAITERGFMAGVQTRALRTRYLFSCKYCDTAYRYGLGSRERKLVY